MIVIVVAYLVKIERREDFRQVWHGVGAAVAVSLIAVGELEGRAMWRP